jgi:hypothetical protein
VRRGLFGAAGAWGQCAPASPGRRFCAALNFTVRGAIRERVNGVWALALQFDSEDHFVSAAQ